MKIKNVINFGTDGYIIAGLWFFFKNNTSYHAEFLTTHFWLAFALHAFDAFHAFQHLFTYFYTLFFPYLHTYSDILIQAFVWVSYRISVYRIRLPYCSSVANAIVYCVNTFVLGLDTIRLWIRLIKYSHSTGIQHSVVQVQFLCNIF